MLHPTQPPQYQHPLLLPLLPLLMYWKIRYQCHIGNEVDFLITLFKRALKEEAEASQDFAELNENVTEEQRDEWERMMVEANSKRIEDPTAMDVYNSSLPKGTCPNYACKRYANLSAFV